MDAELPVQFYRFGAGNPTFLLLRECNDRVGLRMVRRAAPYITAKAYLFGGSAAGNWIAIAIVIS